MHRHCKLTRSRVLRDTFTTTPAPLLDFLLPSFHQPAPSEKSQERRSLSPSARYGRRLEACFFNALAEVSSCQQHKKRPSLHNVEYHGHLASLRTTRRHAHSLRHQRYDSQGRLIVETTAPRHPAFPHEEYENDYVNDSRDQQFAANTRLPPSFFSDLSSIRNLTPGKHSENPRRNDAAQQDRDGNSTSVGVKDQLKLMRSVRDLEERLQRAKQDLAKSISTSSTSTKSITSRVHRPTTLTKKDYLNLVDLYFYSHNSRFSPESSDASPTPIVLNDYSFILSADFSNPANPEIEEEEQDDYVSPLREIEEALRNNQLREIAVMQVFIDLLLQDDSPNRALFEAYKELPQPGVAYLPRGVVRLLLQRMSTPWVKTQASKLRYLSLIDDMQEAKLPLTLSEWSSAVYLAGRSFSRIDLNEVGRAFNIWRQMETDAGVRSSHVTFNILFDVAVRAGKFALGETILAEMHKRNLRLNRMGRVSLMYYHGLRGDGDGVRKAYHDFVEAGEIVDTLVLNCVIASLINAQEPTAAEQIYQRMKDMQATLRKGWTDDGQETLFKLHPAPGSNMIGDQMASNQLGRVLGRASHLRDKMPEKHQELQASMPLTPNFTTFRVMLAYHAGISGDLDRMTVLLNEMLENFDIPLFPVVFQLLFKGFAIHGPKGGPDSAWSKARLDMTWDACRVAIKDSIEVTLGKPAPWLRDLPSISDVRSGMSYVTQAEEQGQPKTRTLSMWETLVVDLAAFPRERLTRLQRYHSEQFDEDIPTSAFTSPFFQQAHYDAPQPELDAEEGEYTLPNPIKSALVNTNRSGPPNYADDDGLDSDLQTSNSQTDEDEEWDRPPTSPQESASYSSFSAFPNADSRTGYRLRATKPLVCWLLRAYSRVTGSRALVEEVWGSVRKIWHPKDDVEAQVVIKVLVRCLRDCDRLSGHA